MWRPCAPCLATLLLLGCSQRNTIRMQDGGDICSLEDVEGDVQSGDRVLLLYVSGVCDHSRWIIDDEVFVSIVMKLPDQQHARPQPVPASGYVLTRTPLEIAPRVPEFLDQSVQLESDDGGPILTGRLTTHEVALDLNRISLRRSTAVVRQITQQRHTRAIPGIEQWVTSRASPSAPRTPASPGTSPAPP